MSSPLQLAGLDSNLLPREVTGPIFDVAQEQSVVMQLGQRIPIGFGDTAIPTVTSRPEAGVVGLQSGDPSVDGSEYYGEGKKKPVSGYQYNVETIRPIKLSTIVVVSEEFQRTNPSGFYDQISGDLSYAIARAVDLAVLYGKSANNNATIPGVKFLTSTTQSVNLGTATKDDGGFYADLLSAARMVASAGPGYTPSAFAADDQFKYDALAAVDPFGRPLLQTGSTPSLTNNVDTLLGLPVVYGRSVSGRVGSNPTDSGVRAVLGDYRNQLRWGTALDVSMRASNQASIDMGDGNPVNLWQNNLTAMLVEIVFGWAVGSLEAFAAIKDPNVGATTS